jgi:hypothetical protein
MPDGMVSKCRERWPELRFEIGAGYLQLGGMRERRSFRRLSSRRRWQQMGMWVW